MTASQISPELETRISRYRIQRTTRTMLTGTGLHWRRLLNFLVIANPTARHLGRIYIEYATSYVLHHHDGQWDPLGVLDGIYGTTHPVTAQTITTLLSSPPPPATGPPPPP